MQKLRENAWEILNLYNYFNGAIIFDREAVAVYYYNNRPDINPLTEKDVVGKHLLEIYPGLDPQQSTILKALKTGTPTANMQQKIRSCKGTEILQTNTTLPIFEGKELIGAVEVSTYILDQSRGNLYITPSAFGSRRNLYTVDDLISVSRAMEQVKEKIGKVARTDSSVFIYGKTGTGKEVAAEAIHTGGRRKKQKFLSQNCAAIPPALLESILFGTVRGSFTGAQDRQGLLEAASGGTLFLDEIHNMDAALQAKILRAIEEQKVTRVGDYEARDVDVRIIAAANETPRKLLEEGKLRRDLYYRLRVVQIDLPPLADRKEDIPVLAEHFIEKYNKIMKKNIAGIDAEVERQFLAYSWPGNVRELENLIEGAFNFARGPFLHREDIPWRREHQTGNFPPYSPEDGLSLKTCLHRYEKQLITEAMERHDAIQEVLRELGISRQNLNHKLKQYHIENKFDRNRKF